MHQLSLIEPTRSECPALAADHLRKAAQFRKGADVFAARGMSDLADQYRERAAGHEDEAETLAMYADLLARAKVSA